VKAATGISDTLMRISVGLEAFDDVRDDFAAALA
jgi:cystathionine beta-lyase/cystathionine gamma-synthase